MMASLVASRLVQDRRQLRQDQELNVLRARAQDDHPATAASGPVAT
jgi:hypothetical protein